MRPPDKNGLICISVFVLVMFFILSCAAKTKSTKPEEKPAPTTATKEELPKPETKIEVEPAPKPSEQETTRAAPSPTTEPTASPVLSPQVTQEPAQRTTEIALPLVNLREGPNIKHKITHVLKKGTRLIVLEEKLGWLHVRLQEGIEGWVAKSTTLEGIQPSRAVPPRGQK